MSQIQTSLRIFVKLPTWDFGYHVHVARPTSSGKLAVMQPCVFKVVEDAELVESQPALILEKTDAQRLMDELWNCGVRPSEGTGSAGAMAATQAHLKDMQRLVFKDKL